MPGEILVAGGAGLVGRNLIRRLSAAGLPCVASVHSRDVVEDGIETIRCDFTDFGDCLKATTGKDSVVLCAAISHGAKANQAAPTATLLPNLRILAGLLEASARNKVKTVILLSSSTVYQPADSPIKEDDLDLNLPPYGGYFGIGWTFRYLEQLGALYAKTYGMRIVTLRPTNIYGPFDEFQEDKAHVVPSLIRRALKHESPFEVWGPPDVVRDFIFVDDLVDDLLALLRDGVETRGLPVNICSGEPMTIRDAARIILQACRHPVEPVFNSAKPTAIPYRALDDSRSRQLFGRRGRTRFYDGVERTVAWLSKMS